MKNTKITETALRDAHQSLLATRMRTRDMIPVIEELDEIGYFSLEAWGGATFDTCIRYLNEDPWERLREIKEKATRTPIQMLLRGQNLLGYKNYPDDVVTAFVEKSYENGVDVFRIFDALNDIRNMEQSIKVAKAQGAHVQGTISYTISPVHTIDSYVDFAKKLEELDCDSICIKDMAGLITPHAAYELISRLKEETDLLVDLHCHCTSGMAPITYYAACEAGVDILDTAISPVAGGTSQPPTESVVAALQGTKFDTGLDLKLLNSVKVYFNDIREQYGSILDPIAEQIDTDVLLYQIPGGMLSNLVSQLKEQNALDRYQDVLEEMPRTREDMGYPPLVTPTSQIVGIQSVMNVLGGERYKTVSNEVKEYMRGMYGRPPAEVNPDVYKKILGDEKPIDCRPADLLEDEMEKYEKIGNDLGIIKKEEDVLTLALYPQVAEKFLKGEAEEEELKPKVPVSEDPLAIPTQYNVEVDGDVFDVKIIPTGYLQVEETDKGPFTPVEGAITSSMQGMVLNIKVEVGDKVAKGSTVAVLEAMKMENDILAEKDGVVTQILVEKGDAVSAGDTIMVIE
ncbi:sodium-extruding oxaloacetate decarboxylase subunit alpha [Methanobrevibacter sp.]